jgi:ATP-dependent helicase/nuclease subunit B
MVVLPGLDTDMSEREWDMVSETHPQYALRQLLEKMECKRGDVGMWDGGEVGKPPPRLTCLRAILQPPEATAAWAGARLPLQEGLSGVKLLEADTLLDEARMIAIALREALETPGKTAALVTPDRQLARIVASQMQRFGVSIDDSAGRPLLGTPPGCFLRLCAGLIASAAAPAELLALLRHPLAGAGMDTAECRRLSRMLEINMLRGVRRTPGLAALAVAAGEKSLQHLLDRLNVHASALSSLFAKRSVSLMSLLKEHMAFAEWLASTDKEKGPERLWAGEAGNTLAAFLAELMAQADVLEEVDPMSYPALFDTLLSEQVWRLRYGQHPRLQILSPIEARLLQFDLVILGGMNEGTWPASPAADPWMSRPMRASFGLPSLERSIGQAAHDVTLLAASPEVILSRARKVEGAPAVPSRWLVRLETLVEGLDAELYAHMQVRSHYGEGKDLLDAALALPALERPEPRPPLGARPRQLRVTAIDHWISDPYRIYARYILGLRALDPLDEEPDAADFGNLVHKAMESFTRACPADLPVHAYELLINSARAAFADFIDRPGVAALWWPRFEAMADWLIEQERARRSQLLRVLAETRGRLQIKTDGEPFTITTSIDRMELSRDDTLTIVDYKTGIPPTGTAIKRGEANQLPLEALIVMHGVLEPALASRYAVRTLEYWKLAGNPANCKISGITEALEPLLEETQARMQSLITRFDQVSTAYAASSETTLYNDYEQLTRRQEWETI